MRSVFDRYVGGVKTRQEYVVKARNSEGDKPFTPADSLTVSRPLLAAKAAHMLINSEKGVTPIVIAVAATDMEGTFARQIDKWFPDSGWGTTAHGASWDTYADTSALLIVSGAALLAPRVTKGGKAAVGLVLGLETAKAGWGLHGNHKYMKAVNEHRVALNTLLEGEMDPDATLPLLASINELPRKLEIPASYLGKIAMAEKLTGVTLAVATNDFDNPVYRSGLTAGALYFASAGSYNGEIARREYRPFLDEMIDEHQTAARTLLDTIN
jgi:hypothetical protein